MEKRRRKRGKDEAMGKKEGRGRRKKRKDGVMGE